MDNKLITQVVKDLKNYPDKVLLVENNDGFLFRDDVVTLLKGNGINIVQGTSIYQRVKYELRNQDEILILLSQDNSSYLDDIKQNAFALEFFIKDYISGFHVPTILEESLDVLDELYNSKQILSLSKKETQDVISNLKTEIITHKKAKVNLKEFSETINKLINTEYIDWLEVSKTVSNALLHSIGTDEFSEVIRTVELVNRSFQEKLEKDYHSSKNSSFVKKPQIVSKILDYLDFNFKKEKIALIVIDGLSYWQYELISNKLPGVINEDVIYSWIPSITQLSRQAIFKGASPKKEYRQGPVNEEKLWKNYWKEKGIRDFEIRYSHQNIATGNLINIKRFAAVYKDLDDYMHSSKDYNDLLKLTENWLERSGIIDTINTLLDNNFKVFLATDHGNIQAKGWRNLIGKEKLGTNKSGSRSQRHLEYSENWLSDDFISNNPELKDSIVMEEQAIYFKDDLSFSKEDSLVTHGGAHFLEVLIPFIEIANE